MRDPAIMTSRALGPDYRPAQRPLFDADWLNVFLIVETGNHHVFMLDGDRNAPAFAVQAGANFTVVPVLRRPRFCVGPSSAWDSQFVFTIFGDVWVQQHDFR